MNTPHTVEISGKSKVAFADAMHDTTWRIHVSLGGAKCKLKANKPWWYDREALTGQRTDAEFRKALLISPPRSLRCTDTSPRKQSAAFQESAQLTDFYRNNQLRFLKILSHIQTSKNHLKEFTIQNEQMRNREIFEIHIYI